MTRFVWVFCVGCLFSIASCGDRARMVPVAEQKSSETLDRVCNSAAGLFGVDRASINSSTSLGDLGADELDFVELVMELEEQFDVTISDEAAERMMGSKNWQVAVKNVTMSKLAATIEQQKKAPRVDEIQAANSVEKSGGQIAELNATTSPSGFTEENSYGAKVKVYLNPLVILLAGAEAKKGRPLTRDEVLEIRDNAVFVMMAPEQAKRFYGSLDAKIPVHRIDPDRIWEEWQEIRVPSK